jgi:hypothetical protein
MATIITKFDILSKYLLDAIVDFRVPTGNGIKLALFTNATPPVVTDEEFADLAGELVDGTYTAGGLATTANALVQTGGSTAWDADDVSFPSLTGTFRYGVLYLDDTVDGVVKPLIAFILFDDTPADVVLVTTTYNVVWTASGIIALA